MDKLNLDKKSLRKFGITMGIAFLVLTLVLLIKQRHSILSASIIAILFFICAFILPVLLKPVYIFWMKLAFVLSWINTRLILFIIFYLIFAPIGLAMRLFRVDLLDLKIERNRETYWKQKERREFNPLNYEKRF